MSERIPLTPFGAARVSFLAARGLPPPEPAAGLPAIPERLREAALGWEGGEESLQLAWELARCAPSLDPAGQRALLVLALATLAARREGSTRLSLAADALGERLARLGCRPSDRDAVLALLASAERGGPGAEAIGLPGAFTPLVRAGGHLYAQRHLRLEERLAAALRERMGTAPTGDGGIDAALAAVLAHPSLSAGKRVELSEEQLAAVEAALRRPLTVVSGGPGTGKTSIVGSILRALARLGTPPEAIALAAPTGKAANRMDGAIRRYLEGIPSPSAEDAALLAARPEARTLHRLLGYSPSADRFRHHENNRLAERVVIVDEASMIDLSLMERLVRAVRPDARLVLLGDADQLPSVEAGAVLRDLLPPADAPADDPRRASAVRLTRSYRMDPADPAGRAILTVARAIQAGELDEVLPAPVEAAGPGSTGADVGPRGSDVGAGDTYSGAGGANVGAGGPGEASGGTTDAAADAIDPARVLSPAAPPPRVVVRTGVDALRFEGVELVEGAAGRDALLARWYELHVRQVPDLERRSGRVFRRGPGGFSPADEEELAALFRHHERFRILCLLRGDGGGAGALAANEALHRLAGATGPGPIPGEPLLVRRNDYARGLFNGDQGLVLRVADGGTPRLAAVFPANGGGAPGRDPAAPPQRFVSFPLEALRGDVDLAWAMTVHRSQGSEFDRVLLLLPPEDVPLLTREILYTAVTRSRRSVVIAGDRRFLALGAGRPVLRDSGVGERLVAPAREGDGGR